MRVSVICPTYNRQDLLFKAIRSFIEQDYKDCELIVVADGENEGLDENIKPFLKYDPRIRFIRKDHTNAADTINCGIKSSTGDLICQLHDDDELTPGSITKRVAVFEKNQEHGLEVIWTAAQLIDVNGNVTGTFPAKPCRPWEIMKNEYIYFPTLMWRRSVHDKIGFLDTSFIYYYDYFFKVLCLMECACLPYAFESVRYRVHTGQESYKAGRNGGLINSIEKKKMFDLLRPVYRIL